MPSSSLWNNAVVLVCKKHGALRFCIDFGCLNAHMKKDALLLAHIHDAINALCSSHYYFTVDLLSRFWQTLIAEDLKKYTAFTVGMLGFFQCECMAFSLCKTTATHSVVNAELSREQLDLPETRGRALPSDPTAKQSKVPFYQTGVPCHEVRYHPLWDISDWAKVFLLRQSINDIAKS